jgi:rRNA maturation RNase YbeY
MPVTLSCRTEAARPWRSYVRVRGRQILRGLGRSRDELSLSLVDDREIRTLNATYRGRDRATDVLAFALTETSGDVPVAASAAAARVLGDVVISIETAAAQARASRCALAERLDALLIHGVLHLIGYDHERSPAEERRMNAKARAVRAALSPAPRPAGASAGTAPRGAAATAARRRPTAAGTPRAAGTATGRRRRTTARRSGR